MTFKLLLRSAAACAALALSFAPAAAQAPTPTMAPDIAKDFQWPTAAYDYVKRVEMVPMRDGTKLYTVMIIPKGAKDAPILLTRTPYNAKRAAQRALSPHAAATGQQVDEPFLADGYIRVYQDVRGKYGSEGDYVLNRPLRGPLNSTDVDHSTDAYDTIDWLVKNLKESNGRVGITGSSYPGFTSAMALINPHPALKAAVPQSPMVDGWMGDDWFQNGAFRMINFDWFTSQMTVKGEGDDIPRQGFDDYDNFLRAGSAGDYAKAAGLDQIPAWRKISEHPSYDAWWQGQALDKILAKQPLKVPTLWVGALWDQEDIYGAIKAYQATEPKDAANDMNFLALGPWRHSGVNYEQRQLGPNLKLPGDTATEFRTKVMKPFLDQHLKSNPPKADIPPVFIFDSGAMEWNRLQKYPQACESGCAAAMKPIYLTPGLGLSFDKATKGEAYEEYVSDPAKPVPYVRRPVRWDDPDQWRFWLTSDQRHVDGRPDVLTFVTEPLKAPLKISGEPVVNLFASTSGTDSDWVVKLIDVYPDTVPSDPQMGGYELGVAMEIFRGRYRESFEKPTPIPAGKVQKYRYELPPTNHVFKPGHRIMVQVQSSWFPLYDRNPQTFVPNVFFAKPSDYRKATQRIYLTGDSASSIELPVVPVQ
ncbi:MAG: glutaryl-7-ACA acylase [Phenylobacterium sp. RIFCSPHIGHO2_01_FULL_69_31]|uniref:CocE/NonD family hydrolase n=1 Tax=Phenylobacterium sp. RIFCSPHIGHO2_01_FULL_69_31 TaxID=1801944 RepID=UPI0008C9411C|nr:CocE/NonD family hydrolase [Phenylobacterium sp. RIFCSPHIGHO2_01_FULL_69_31]OHB31285.1 MAG: glutaryl-7-ACA acylase [Phenylobacterium sp. RIFCSPHIGHO2_01_FULL_69_31]